MMKWGRRFANGRNSRLEMILLYLRDHGLARITDMEVDIPNARATIVKAKSYGHISRGKRVVCNDKRGVNVYYKITPSGLKYIEYQIKHKDVDEHIIWSNPPITPEELVK